MITHVMLTSHATAPPHLQACFTDLWSSRAASNAEIYQKTFSYVISNEMTHLTRFGKAAKKEIDRRKAATGAVGGSVRKSQEIVFEVPCLRSC